MKKKREERKEMSREEGLELEMIVLRIEQLEWEMAHLRKSRRKALLVLKRAEKRIEKRKGEGR